MNLRRTVDEAKRGSNLLRLPEASEEKKKIAASYLVPREMALRGTSLPEDRTPSRGALDRIASQIGIEMRAVASPDSAACEVFDYLRN